jgi:hypothetical protein
MPNLGLGKGERVDLLVDDRIVATGRVERTVPMTFTVDEGMDVGEDSGYTSSLSRPMPHPSAPPRASPDD